jgi:lysophospholipase L1-like esterase
MGFGDSITVGEGSSGGGYREELANMLRAYWGKADVVDEGLSGSKSSVGRGRIGVSLGRRKPAYVLVLYGTNDFNEPDCRNPDRFPCYTIDALRDIVQDVRGWGAWPILGTIPPVNTAYTDRVPGPEERNDWVRRMNELVRAMARQEQVAIAEVHGAFLQQPSLPALFYDYVHPNDSGYRLIAQAFFNAITRPLSASNSGRGPALSLFRRPH